MILYCKQIVLGIEYVVSFNCKENKSLEILNAHYACHRIDLRY